MPIKRNAKIQHWWIIIIINKNLWETVNNYSRLHTVYTFCDACLRKIQIPCTYYLYGNIIKSEELVQFLKKIKFLWRRGNLFVINLFFINFHNHLELKLRISHYFYYMYLLIKRFLLIISTTWLNTSLGLQLPVKYRCTDSQIYYIRQQ